MTLLFINLLLLLACIYAVTIVVFFIGLFKKNTMVNTIRHKVTVIIAARNEEGNIGNLLEDLTRQTYSQELYNVIVVDDGSSDRTPEIIRSFTEKYSFINVLTIKNVPPGYSPKKFAIQSAVDLTDSHIILTTDADCRLGARWIEAMAACFAPGVGFVIGFSQFGASVDNQNFIERLQAFDFMQMMGVAAGCCNMGSPMASSGQNLGYLRDAFIQVGGYSRVAHRISGDDVLLLQMIKKDTDYKIVFAMKPDAFAVSQPQPTLKSFINQRKRWASNGSYQIYLNFGFFLYLLLVYLYSLFTFSGVIFSLITGKYLLLTGLNLVNKFFWEFLITIKSASLFRRMDLLKYFLVWFLLQPPYIIYVGLLGTFGNFKWKERKHSTGFGKGPKGVNIRNV